jgi:hypothetical protein
MRKGMTKQGAKNQGREGDFHLRPRGKQNKGEATKLQDKQEGAVIKLNRARLASGLASAPERARATNRRKGDGTVHASIRAFPRCRNTKRTGCLSSTGIGQLEDAFAVISAPLQS